ncbi:MAG TPA: ABC transporter permease [Jiangellaceae bacterium]|jgi:oligopeptide transport system permease protein|nr:ABC transporter permease [Jiangellaceae bacterium]
MTDPHSLYTPIEAEADQKYHPQAESALEAGTAPPATAQEEAVQQEKPRSLTSDALRDLRRNPIFIVSAVIILVLTVMAIFPGVFTNKDPRFCDLNLSREAPSSEAWFGYDIQGCDVYARTIYGARASILVGLVTTIVMVVLGGLLGMIAGFYGGMTDSIVSRVTDIFFGIPLLLGGILVLASFPSTQATPPLVTIGKVSLAMAILAWTSLARIMRSTVLQVKQADYVNAARALGGGAPRILRKHVVPNALAPVIVYATIVFGIFIATEATLSFLGIGLVPPVISWGVAINNASDFVRQSPHMLLFPGLFLSITVLAFIMMGDAVRDAFDPRLR